MRRLFTMALVPVLVLAFSACGGDADETVTPDPPATEPEPGGAPVTIALAELDGSGITGTARLTAQGDATTVFVTLEGAGDGPQPIHIHPGTCDDLDPAPKHPLNNVDSGRSETTVEASLEELLDGDFAINVHKSPEEPQIYVACGAITAP